MQDCTNTTIPRASPHPSFIHPGTGQDHSSTRGDGRAGRLCTSTTRGCVFRHPHCPGLRPASHPPPASRVHPPPTHPSPHIRAAQLAFAIKLLYTSCYFHKPRQYRRPFGLSLSSEALAVMIQEVPGAARPSSGLFYPDLSCHAMTFSYYPFSLPRVPPFPSPALPFADMPPSSTSSSSSSSSPSASSSSSSSSSSSTAAGAALGGTEEAVPDIHPPASTITPTEGVIQPFQTTAVKATFAPQNCSPAEISATLPSWKTLTVTGECISDHCTSTGNGAAASVDMTSGGHLSLPSTLTSTDCSASTDEGLFLLASSLSSFVTTDPLAPWVSTLLDSIASSSKAAQLVGSVHTADEAFTFCLLHIAILPTHRGDSSVLVAADESPAVGADVTNCGWSDIPCLTIHTAYTPASTLNTLSIHLADGTHTPASESTSFPSGTVSLLPSGSDAVTNPLSTSGITPSLFTCSRHLRTPSQNSWWLHSVP